MAPSRTTLLTLLLAALSGVCASQYYGRSVGTLSELQHGVKGQLYAVDSRTLYLHDFEYDGEGPAAYFYVGKSGSPSASGGIRLRDERGSEDALRKYRGEGVALTLPDGITLKDIKWFAVWCDRYSVNFGDVKFPRSLDYPRPAKVAPLNGVHGVHSDPIVIVDAQTLLIPDFSYDGEAPDAKFWVGRGEKPSPQGIRIPDENGKESPLRKYDNKTIVLTLPGDLTVFDIGHFGVWCEAFTVNFGHVTLPRAQISNVPPSLKMLGVLPQNRNRALTAAEGSSTPKKTRKPIARLDATTYRPQLRLGAIPLQAIDDQGLDKSAIYRRTDNYTPPTEQIIPQDSKNERTHDEPPQQQHLQAPQKQNYLQILPQQKYAQQSNSPPDQFQNYYQQQVQIPTQQHPNHERQFQQQFQNDETVSVIPQQIYYFQSQLPQYEQLRYEQELNERFRQLHNQNGPFSQIIAGRYRRLAGDLDPFLN